MWLQCNHSKSGQQCYDSAEQLRELARTRREEEIVRPTGSTSTVVSTVSTSQDPGQQQIPPSVVSITGNRPSRTSRNGSSCSAGAILVRRENAGTRPCVAAYPAQDGLTCRSLRHSLRCTRHLPAVIPAHFWSLDRSSSNAGQRPGCFGFELDSCRLTTIDESRTTSGGKAREAAASVPPSSSAQRFSTRTTRLNLFVIAMAIAKAVAHAPIVKPEPPQHKRVRSLMFLAHHGGVDLTQAPTASRQSKHKHHKHKHGEHRHKHHKSATPVYDQCFHEAMKLKTRILIEHRERPTRFSLSVMKRVVIPPVNIPKKLAVRRGSSDLVSGKRVPFTKAMWETRKRIYSKTHSLPVIHESFRL